MQTNHSTENNTETTLNKIDEKFVENSLNKIDKTNSWIRKYTQKMIVDDLEALLSRSLSSIFIIMLIVFLMSTSLELSIVIGAFLSIPLMYFMMYRIIDSYQKRINKLEQELFELKQRTS